MDLNANIIASLVEVAVIMCAFSIGDCEMTVDDGIVKDGENRVSG
jgi:hypothetical protein